MSLSNLEQRALAAYFRSGSQSVGIVQQPGAVETIEREGLTYIRLTNATGLLAVYRVRIVNGEPMLKKLKRYPAAVAEGC